MNRRQKVAVVVGAVVIFWVAIHPPWTGTRKTYIASESGPLLVERHVSHGHKFRFPSDGRRDCWRHNRRNELIVELEGTGEVVAFVSTPEIDHVRSAIEIAATLALTLAAVVVLKERKVARDVGRTEA